jgi:hypothetical protein
MGGCIENFETKRLFGLGGDIYLKLLPDTLMRIKKKLEGRIVLQGALKPPILCKCFRLIRSNH